MKAPLFLCTLLLLNTAASADTILSPRTKAEHEADLKALQDKYGPARDDAAALTASSVSPRPPAAEPAPAARPAVPAAAPTPGPAAPAAAGSERVRVTLYPEGARGFLFNGKSYDTASLTQVLQELGRQQRMDSLLLLESEDRIVELTHVVELAKLGKALKLPTMYQQGQEFKSISAD
ncbi:MAG: hypothetical protein MUE46_20400 [Xanthomonadales bacterium]|jgi:hypothetical protein|nr:hypothetical protein [Xanthomonadales bacterium]